MSELNVIIGLDQDVDPQTQAVIVKDKNVIVAVLQAYLKPDGETYSWGGFSPDSLNHSGYKCLTELLTHVNFNGCTFKVINK